MTVSIFRHRYCPYKKVIIQLKIENNKRENVLICKYVDRLRTKFFVGIYIETYSDSDVVFVTINGGMTAALEMIDDCCATV